MQLPSLNNVFARIAHTVRRFFKSIPKFDILRLDAIKPDNHFETYFSFKNRDSSISLKLN